MYHRAMSFLVAALGAGVAAVIGLVSLEPQASLRKSSSFRSSF